MDLDIELAPARPGRPLESSIEFVRALEPEDLLLLAESKPAPKRLKRLHDSHHAAARAIATGMKHNEVTLITGYSATRISQLMQDPSFSDLVAFYRKNLDVAAAGLFEKFAAFSKDLFDELRARFEAEPEKFSDSFILEAMKTMADRSGTGPRSVNVNVNVDLAGRLEQARRNAGLDGGPSEGATGSASSPAGPRLPPPSTDLKVIDI